MVMIIGWAEEGEDCRKKLLLCVCIPKTCSNVNIPLWCIFSPTPKSAIFRENEGNKWQAVTQSAEAEFKRGSNIGTDECGVG